MSRPTLCSTKRPRDAMQSQIMPVVIHTNDVKSTCSLCKCWWKMVGGIGTVFSVLVFAVQVIVTVD